MSTQETGGSSDAAPVDLSDGAISYFRSFYDWLMTLTAEEARDP